MRRNAKQSKKNSRKPNYSQIIKPIAVQPPVYQSQENRTWSIRATCTAAAASNFIFTMNQLAAFLGIFATSSTTSVFLCDQFRLRRVCVWGPVTTAGTPVTVTIKYVDDPAGTNYSVPPKTMTGVSSNVNEYAYVCLQPPRDNTSIFSQWSDSSTTTPIFVLSCPIGSIIQFWFNFILDDIGATSIGPVIAGASSGVIYHKNMTSGGATFVAIPPLNSV